MTEAVTGTNNEDVEEEYTLISEAIRQINHPHISGTVDTSDFHNASLTVDNDPLPENLLYLQGDL